MVDTKQIYTANLINKVISPSSSDIDPGKQHAWPSTVHDFILVLADLETSLLYLPEPMYPNRGGAVSVSI